MRSVLKKSSHPASGCPAAPPPSSSPVTVQQTQAARRLSFSPSRQPEAPNKRAQRASVEQANSSHYPPPRLLCGSPAEQKPGTLRMSMCVIHLSLCESVKHPTATGSTHTSAAAAAGALEPSRRVSAGPPELRSARRQQLHTFGTCQSSPPVWREIIRRRRRVGADALSLNKRRGYSNVLYP